MKGEGGGAFFAVILIDLVVHLHFLSACCGSVLVHCRSSYNICLYSIIQIIFYIRRFIPQQDSLSVARIVRSQRTNEWRLKYIFIMDERCPHEGMFAIN